MSKRVSSTEISELHPILHQRKAIGVADLPPELIFQLFSYLNSKDLTTCFQVCKNWCVLSEGQWLWKELFLRDFSCAPLEAMTDFKQSYKKEHTQQKLIQSRLTKKFFASDIVNIKPAGKCNFFLKDKRLFTSYRSRSGEVRIEIRDIASFALAITLQGLPSIAMGFECNGDQFFAGFRNGEIKVWRLNSIQQPVTFKAHENCVDCLIIAEKWLISGSRDRMIKIWDPISYQCKAVLKGHSEWIRCLAYAHGWIFSGSENEKEIKVWKLSTGQYHASLEGHENGVMSLAFVGRNLFSSSTDKIIKVWDISSLRCVHTFEAHQMGISSLKAAEGKLFTCSEEDSTIKVWNPLDYSCIASFNTFNEPVEVSFAKGKFFFITHSNELLVLDLTASDQAVLEDIADVLGTRDEERTPEALTRFEELPEHIKTKIYKNFYFLLFNESYPDGFKFDEVELNKLYKETWKNYSKAEAHLLLKFQAIKEYLDSL